MTRADFLKKLGIAMGASALPMTALATTMTDDTISDDVLKEKIQVFYFDKSFEGGKDSRYYLKKTEAFMSWLLIGSKHYQNAHHYYPAGWNDVITAIQGVAWKSKFCLPKYGGDSAWEFTDFNNGQFSDEAILTKEVTFEEFLNHNSNEPNDSIVYTKQHEALRA